MEYITHLIWIIPVLISLIFFLFFKFLEKTYKKDIKKKEDKLKENKKPDKISPTNSKYIMEFLNDLIKVKFEYYLYKDILPVYIGNENNKKEKFKKEKFIEIKEFFFKDIFMSLSKEVKKELITLFTEAGIEIYIHQRFATLFNKTDAKFLNMDEDIKDNMFFMSDKMN